MKNMELAPAVCQARLGEQDMQRPKGTVGGLLPGSER